MRNLSHSLWKVTLFHQRYGGPTCLTYGPAEMAERSVPDGLADHSARFSGQRTNYSGMDAEVPPRAGVAQSSQPCCSTQVECETPADSPRRSGHLLALARVRRRSETLRLSRGDEGNQHFCFRSCGRVEKHTFISVQRPSFPTCDLVTRPLTLPDPRLASLWVAPLQGPRSFIYLIRYLIWF